MKNISEWNEFFENLKANSSIKSEIKIYNSFNQILRALKDKSLSAEQIKSIEQKLQTLELDSNPVKRKKFYRKALDEFKAFIKNDFAFILKGYYTNLGIGLGSTFGIIVGIVFLSNLERSLGIVLGVSFGMLIGLLIGRRLDAQAQAEGRVL